VHLITGHIFTLSTRTPWRRLRWTQLNALVASFHARNNGWSRAEIHHEELLKDWELLQSGRPPLKIEPLR